MINEAWGAYAVAFLALAFIEGVLYIRRSRKSMNARALLKRAKQEAQEIAQLPLNNPHPQIQISETGEILFANPVTLKLFPGIEAQGFDHPVLNSIQNIDSREVFFDNKIYHQTIAQTSVNGEIAYVIYCYDITDRKRHEKDLQAAHKRAETMRAAAEDAKEARGEFLANMSHELRTPMNGIIGLSDILVETGLKGEKQSLIEAVNSSARSLLILLNDILDFSKIEAGELTMEKISFDVRKVVQQIENLQNPVASQKGLVMKSQVAENVPLYLVGDPSRLQQILNNLMSNALKFTEEGSVTLHVSGKEDNKGNFITCFAVTDTGIGIPKEKQAKIFEKFQQADASTARKYGGTGLGLAITKDLTELMNGTIAIESEENTGTTFTVTIPTPIAENQQEDSTGPEKQKSGINMAAKIMIVDDHPINLLFMRQTLTKMGFQDFDEATSGKQALDYFGKQTYDVIIMDCQIPEMDGFEASRKIREIEDSETAPIIIAATADAMKGAEDKCMAAGMDDYISKPVDKEKLRGILERWIPGNETAIQAEINREEKTMDQSPLTTEKDVLDWERLFEFTEGNKEMESQIINMFVDNLRNDITALHQSLQDKNYEAWDSWVHKIYGACSHIGANALAEICDEGQTLVPEKTHKIPEVHGVILNEYKRVQNYLKERQKERQAA